MFSLKEKTALVTGATGGIGEAIARHLQQAGARVAISGTRAEKLEALAKDMGGDTAVLPCNLSDNDAVEKLIPDAEAAFGKLDILVCNAGVTKDGLAMRMKDEDWEQVIAINLSSTFRLNRAAVKAMMKRKYGRIVNISSIVGVMGNPGQANYCASKAGMIGMSKSLAAEVASRNITVNCVAPGFITTPMTEALNDQQKERIAGNIPMGKMGSPADIAAATLFLSSDESGYITGQTIHVNGGLLMV